MARCTCCWTRRTTVAGVEDPLVLLNRGIAHMKDGQTAKGERLIRGASEQFRLENERLREIEQVALELASQRLPHERPSAWTHVRRSTMQRLRALLGTPQ